MWCGILTAAAQDLIVKTDASKIEANVVEVSPESVRYKRFSNPDGPTYVLPVTEIHYIRYANGEKEFYTRPSDAAEPAETPEAAAEIAAGDEVRADLDEGTITDVTTGKTFKARPFPPFIQNIIEAGGLINSLKK